MNPTQDQKKKKDYEDFTRQVSDQVKRLGGYERLTTLGKDTFANIYKSVSVGGTLSPEKAKEKAWNKWFEDTVILSEKSQEQSGEDMDTILQQYFGRMFKCTF